MSVDPTDLEQAGPMIPGAYERNTRPHREPAGPRVALPAGASSMDAATIADREREGGGAPSQRRRQAPGAPRLTGGFRWLQILRRAR